MTTIEFEKNSFLFVAYVQRETEKAFLCELICFTGPFDAVKLNRLIWLPKSAVNNGKLANWLAYKLDLSGSWEGVSLSYPKSAPTQEAVVCDDYKELRDAHQHHDYEQENEDRAEQAEIWFASQGGHSYQGSDLSDLL